MNFRFHRKLPGAAFLTAQGNSDLYISINSGTANQFTVTIDLFSRYSDSKPGGGVKANSCDIYLTSDITC